MQKNKKLFAKLTLTIGLQMNNFYTANIEMYFYTENEYPDSDHYAEKILVDATNNKRSIDISADNFLLVTTLLWEPHLLDKMHLYVNLFRSFKQRKIKTILILDSYFKDIDEKILQELDTKIYFVDYFLWRTFDKVVQQNKSMVSKEWNNKSKSFLLLNGKPDRPNRIRLLWKLKLLLERATWSLHVKEGTYKQCRLQLPELNDKEFDDFVKQYNRNPDNAKVMFQDNSLHYGGIPYDVKMFDECLFRIITETNINLKPTPWLTEKTWITILNKLPFIMAGDLGSLQKLKRFGFRTFEEYLPRPEYDDIKNVEDKLDAIVENCKFWLDEMSDKEQIANDVEHNYNLMLSIAQKNKSMLEGICTAHHINPARIEEICTTFDILGNE